MLSLLWGWEDSKMFDLQAGGPEFSPQNPCFLKSQVWWHQCVISSTQEAGAGAPWGSLASQPSILGKFQPHQRLVWKEQGWCLRKNNPGYPSHTCTHKYTHTSGHTHAHAYMHTTQHPCKGKLSSRSSWLTNLAMKKKTTWEYFWTSWDLELGHLETVDTKS